MTERDSRAETPAVNWGELGVSALPTGTVTLLLADVEDSTRLWETQPEEMTDAVARLDRALADLLDIHAGVRPVEQGEGDSFVLAFTRATEATACALELQRAPVDPIRLRIGLHTGEVQLRDEGNYVGPTINRAARLRDLAHGGQTVLSGTTEDLIADALPADAWLTDLGTHELRGVIRPERVVQLCHPGIRNDFPPLRTSKSGAAEHLPAQLTSFIGRGEQIHDVRRALAANRLVTLTGAGGAGKTRLAIQVAGQMTAHFGDGVRYVDLAPITQPDLVPAAMAAALGLADQPSRSTTDMIIRFVRERRMLVLLDNCEHVLDACAALVDAVLTSCPGLTLLATSREPIGAASEVTWQVPSLSLDDEAIELFVDRARRVRAGFTVTDDGAVKEICRRLDGMPLAIELAAARVRALTLLEILESLHDRFRLLTGGSRTAVRRQQTLQASVDWSHALLTEPERVLFRRLAVFLAGSVSRPLRPSPAAPRRSATRSWISWRFWWINRWSSPMASVAERAITCSKRCASTPYRSSVNPAKPMLCGHVTATTTPRWPTISMRRRPRAASRVSKIWRPRSTTYVRHSPGAARTRTSTSRYNLPRRSSRCGSREVVCAKGSPGSMAV